MRIFSPALLGLALLAAPALNGCVTARKYDDLSARQKADADGKAAAERQLQATTGQLQKASDELAQLRLTQKRLVTDSTETGNAYRKTRSLYNDLNTSYDTLLKNSDRELANKSSDYNKVAKDLARREAELGELETTLQKSKANNDQIGRAHV